MDSRSRLQSALFGFKAGAVWVADDVFVTRKNDGLLVERWVGPRVVSILVQASSDGPMRTLWAELNDRAMGDAA